MSIPGFVPRRLPGHNVEIDALVGGEGPPLLLLHGFPQTRRCWRQIAPTLAQHFTVVVPDLRGYGRSEKPRGDDRHDTYAKRTMALDQVATMRHLGFDRFAVAGHDRGARVAYRLALDHPTVVTRVAVLDIIPTAEVYARATAATAMNIYHWYMLAQPAPLPETLLAGDPAAFVRYTVHDWAAAGATFDAADLDDYVRCFDAASIHAACEDYRAGWTRDREADEADRGTRPITAPLLALWGRDYPVAQAQPLATWQRWATDVVGTEVAGGHFVCEEAPTETCAALLKFFTKGAST